MKYPKAGQPTSRQSNLAGAEALTTCEQGDELRLLKRESSDTPAKALDWCNRAIEHLKRDVAQLGCDWNAESKAALPLTLGANGQRIVELFLTTHRRVSVLPVRQRIVESGGRAAPSGDAARTGRAVLPRTSSAGNR
jgi:hypothetical protein